MTSIYYETFDILSDEELRIALKTYADWPTYPQVYVNGDLVGGFETIKDMYDSGELIYTLNVVGGRNESWWKKKEKKVTCQQSQV